MDTPRNNEDHDSKEKKALKEFRKMLSDVITEDHTGAILLKYLRAKNFHLRKSEMFFRTYLNINVSLQLENIDTAWKKPEVLEKYEFLGELGFAKDGTLIRYMPSGRGDFVGFIESIDVIDINRYCASVIEKDLKKCREHSKKLGKEINEITYIIDLDCFSLRQFFSSANVELGFDVIRLFQDYYPEIWKRLLIVNVPRYFSLMYNTFKPILGRNLVQNIQVVSRDGTASLLLKYVDEEVLPAFLGGKRVDSKGDPMCSEFIKFGGRIPAKYFKRNWLRPIELTDPGATEIWLSPRCCYNYSVIVREANSILRIEARSEGGSVLSGILYRKFGPDPEKPDLPSVDEYLDEQNEKCNVQTLLPSLHVQSHLIQTDNQCIAPFPGIYIVIFNNTHSWLSSRRIIIKVRVLPPISS